MKKSITDCLDDLKKQVQVASERLEFFAARGTSGIQEEMLIHFLQRDRQLGESCYLLGSARLRPGLFVLMRVLTEDLFLAYSISRSEEEASKYQLEVLSELARIGLVNLERGRAKIVEEKTGKRVDEKRLADFLSKFKETITAKKERN